MRISTDNILLYLQSKSNETKLIQSKKIKYFPMLLQKNYGELKDCTLTSLTAVLRYKKYFDLDISEIYKIVESNAKYYGYNGQTYGTICVTIRKIINTICSLKSTVKYFKNIGFTYNTIKEQIDKNNPIILSLYKSGNNSYSNHTVTIIGYAQYQNSKMLIVADNWYTTQSYIDYDKLSFISQINYL